MTLAGPPPPGHWRRDDGASSLRAPVVRKAPLEAAAANISVKASTVSAGKNFARRVLRIWFTLLDVLLSRVVEDLPPRRVQSVGSSVPLAVGNYKLPDLNAKLKLDLRE